LTLQQAVQSLVKAAGPRANPQLVMGALNKMLPALNAQGLEQYRTVSEQLRMLQMQQQAREFYYGKGQQQSQFEEKQAAGGGGVGKSEPAQMRARFFQEHPNATEEEYDQYKNSLRPTSATELKQTAAGVESKSINNQLDSAMRDVEGSISGKGHWVSGLGGRINQMKELPANILGFSDETAARDFQTKIEALKVQVMKKLGGSSRVTNEMLSRADNIVRGQGFGVSPQATLTGLSYLKQLMQSLELPAQGPKLGTVEDGYQFKGGDPADKNNWKKLGQ
jgi:hypothetical protein